MVCIVDDRGYTSEIGTRMGGVGDRVECNHSGTMNGWWRAGIGVACSIMARIAAFLAPLMVVVAVKQQMSSCFGILPRSALLR